MWALCLSAVSLGSKPGDPTASPTPDMSDQGVFQISLGGSIVGSEKFAIRYTPDKIEAQAEVHLHLQQDGKTIDMKTFPVLVLDPQFHPLTYSWRQKGAQSSQLDVDFRSSPARSHYRTVGGGEEMRDFVLPQDVVVLDDNVVHHYQLVVDRYFGTSGGKQTFQAFIPQEALPGTLEVQDTGTETTTVGNSTIKLRHLLVTTEITHIDLWADGQQRLQRVSIPDEHLEAVRK